MSRRELVVVWVAAGLMALMLVVPPWIVRQDVYSIRGEHLSSGESVEYACIFSPPKRYSTSVTPAEGLLLLQWAGVAIVAAAVLVTFRQSASGRKR